MAEGWKQVLEDILNTLRDETKSVQTRPSAHSDSDLGEQGTRAVSDQGIASPNVASEAQSTIPSEANEVHLSWPAARLSTVDTQLPEPEKQGPASDLTAPIRSDVATADAEQQPNWLSKHLPSMVVILLLVAGLWIWVSGNLIFPQSEPPAPDIVATFNGGQITLADIEAHLAFLIPTDVQDATRSPDALALVLEDLVTEELIRQWAAQREPNTDETFTHAMQHITEEVSLASLSLEIHESTIAVNESEIRDYYDSNREQFMNQPFNEAREQIRQILVEQREPDYIEEYIQRLKDNATITRNFELLEVPSPNEVDLRRYYDTNTDQFRLARQVVVDELIFSSTSVDLDARQQAEDALLSLRSGATFMQVSEDNPTARFLAGVPVLAETRNPAWEQIAFALNEGEISNVFQTDDAYYIVRLIERQAASTQSLEEARDIIFEIVQQQIAEDWFETNANKTLFTLKGKQYTLGDFYREYQEIPASIRMQFAGLTGMQRMTEQLIERLLLVEDANSQLLDAQDQPSLDEARLDVLAQMMHQEEVDEKLEVTDEEIRVFYDENARFMALPPQSRIRYIRIGLSTNEEDNRRARERADEAYQRLVPGLFQTGESFADIAREYSEDIETAANGGVFPEWVGESDDLLTELELHPLHEQVLMLQPNEISRPFEFGDSLYIIQVIERSEPEPLSFEEAQPRIEDILFDQKHHEMTEQLQAQLLQEANVIVYWPVLEDYVEQLSVSTPVP